MPTIFAILTVAYPCVVVPSFVLGVLLMFCIYCSSGSRSRSAPKSIGLKALMQALNFPVFSALLVAAVEAIS